MFSPLLDPENQTPGRKKRKFSVASNIMDDNMPDAPRDSVNHKDEVLIRACDNGDFNIVKVSIDSGLYIHS